MTFKEFSNKVRLSMEDICRDIFHENRETIKVKKQAVVVKNLVNIYNATLRLSNAKGFHAMSLRDLARESNLSLGALYSYFSSKEQLLAIIQEQGYRITGQLLGEAVDRGAPPENQLEAAITTHLYLSEAMQPWFYFFYMEAKNLGREEQKKAIASELYTEQVFADILEQGIKSGAFVVDDPVMTASLIKAMLQDWYLKRWKYSRRQITVETYAKVVFNFAKNNIKTNN
ncbi:MAG: TetR/AcrR family transcriptional regulator [Thermodesulfobacteriota bacterium]|nr:TetR/AcrR family transcriptional regulator [Thermodesulfobacteriota bacterium]